MFKLGRTEEYHLQKLISFSSSALIKAKLDYFRFHFVHLKKLSDQNHNQRNLCDILPEAE